MEVGGLGPTCVSSAWPAKYCGQFPVEQVDAAERGWKRVACQQRVTAMQRCQGYEGARGEERDVTGSQQKVHPFTQESCSTEVPLGSSPNPRGAPRWDTCDINGVASPGE